MRLPPWETGSPVKAPAMSGFLGGDAVLVLTVTAPSHEATSTVLSSMRLLWAATLGCETPPPPLTIAQGVP